MQERYLTTVDLGSGKIGLCVARITGRNISVLYYKEHPSAGIRHSCVYNPAKAAEALRNALDDAERELNICILQVVVGLPRYSVTQEIASARLECDENICITAGDTDMVKSEALASYPLKNPETETIYGAITQSFSTDELFNAAEDDVIGTTSKFLDGNFKVFVGQRKAISNIDTMLQMAEVACAAKMFLPDATARAILSESELDNGAALIEIGAGVSSLTIYQGNIMRHYCSIPFAGKTITTDIKYECGFSESLAENIKLAWGACMPEKLQNLSDKILQINDEAHGTYEHLGVKYLSEIISARAREIIEALNYCIHDSGLGKRLRCGIVLTGGCAELTNMAAYMRELTGFNVRVGYPHSDFIEIGECTDAESPQASPSIGMLLQAAASLPRLNCLESAPIIKQASIAKPAPAAKPKAVAETDPVAETEPVTEKGPIAETEPVADTETGNGPGDSSDGPAGIFRPEDLKQNLFTEYDRIISGGIQEEEESFGRTEDREAESFGRETEVCGQAEESPVPDATESSRTKKKEKAPKPRKPRREIHWGEAIRSVGNFVGDLFDNIDE